MDRELLSCCALAVAECGSKSLGPTIGEIDGAYIILALYSPAIGNALSHLEHFIRTLRQPLHPEKQKHRCRKSGEPHSSAGQPKLPQCTGCVPGEKTSQVCIIYLTQTFPGCLKSCHPQGAIWFHPSSDQIQHCWLRWGSIWRSHLFSTYP